MTDALSNLRLDPGLPARVGSRLFKGVRTVESTRRPFADWWEAANRTALSAEGPLWLVLGDSASQGLGASSPEAGYVTRVRDLLDQATDERWRVVNLSITGAKIADVVERQLPAAQALGLDPDLVTSLIGANDLLSPWGIDEARGDAERLVAALPVGTLQSRMVAGRPSRPKATAINDGAAGRGRRRPADPVPGLGLARRCGACGPRTASTPTTWGITTSPRRSGRRCSRRCCSASAQE